MRRSDALILVPLILIMFFVALWPKALVGATGASTDRAIAPAQIAADRPAAQIAPGEVTTGSRP
jgi:hypothetical protein